MGAMSREGANFSSQFRSAGHDKTSIRTFSSPDLTVSGMQALVFGRIASVHSLQPADRTGLWVAGAGTGSASTTRTPTMTECRTPREHTKTRRILSLLQTGSGASLEDKADATGWQAHTVRAAMTGPRKRGYRIERHVEGNTTVWSAAGEAA